MRYAVLLFSVFSLVSLGCNDTGASGSVCTALVPSGSAIACDIGWSCDDGETMYELACASESGAFKCACITDGTATSSFAVSSFECTKDTALKTATSGCGWAITIEE